MRAVRQEELRNLLSKQKHVQQVFKNIKKMEKLKVGTKNFTAALNKLKVINDQHMRLISKYLPDLKSTELTGEGGGDVIVNRVSYKDAN